MNAQTKITQPASILGALAAALPKLESAKKNKANPAFKAKYADLSAVIEAIEPIAEHGLWYRQVSHERPDGVAVETFYIHESGELSSGTFFVPADKKNAQGYGSANSYARRYGLQLAFGLATEDDDGSAAVAGGQSKREVSPPPPEPKNWGGRYPTKTALWAACRSHHAELERLGMESTLSDLEDFLTSPEYSDYVATATKQFPWMLEGPAPESMPEFIPTFKLEQKARDLIALRGNVPADAEETK